MTLKIANVSCQVDGITLLKGVSFEAAAGSLVGIIGPNGSGKTTLLRAIAGELNPVEGEISYANVNMHKLTLAQRAQWVAVLPQEANLSFPFSAAEVVAMGRIPHVKAAHRGQIVADVLEEMQLGELQDRVYTTLSGGEKQRVQIGRVLCQIWDMQERALLLLDEPTTALDLAHQLALFKTIRRLTDGGTSAVVVLHDINLALRYCDKLVLIAEGHLMSFGGPREVLQSTQLQEAFGINLSVHETDDLGSPFIVVRD